MVVALVVLFLGKEELILDRSEEDFLVEKEVVLFEFKDLVDVELSFFSWDFSANFSSVVGLMSLVLFLVEPDTESDKESLVFANLVWFLIELETESDKESLVFASLVWFLIEPKLEEEEEIMANFVWFLEELVVDLMSLVWFLELESEIELDFFLID